MLLELSFGITKKVLQFCIHVTNYNAKLKLQILRSLIFKLTARFEIKEAFQNHF